jgi:hypothetical protein
MSNSTSITTIAGLKRALIPGCKLRFVRHVFAASVVDGVVHAPEAVKHIPLEKQARTVKAVRSKDVVFLNHEGEDTYLTFNKGDNVTLDYLFEVQS